MAAVVTFATLTLLTGREWYDIGFHDFACTGAKTWQVCERVNVGRNMR